MRYYARGAICAELVPPAYQPAQFMHEALTQAANLKVIANCVKIRQFLGGVL
jgi:hypothetical protein